MTGAMSISFDQHHSRQTPPPQINRRTYGASIPHSYHTPTSGTNLSVGSLPLHMTGANNPRYSQPPTNLSLNEHFDSMDVPLVPDQLVVPTLPMNLGAQSFSGAFHSGMTHGPEGDLGYALQRPGVVPTGPGAPAQLNPMYMHHQYHMQLQYQMMTHSAEMSHHLSSSYSGVPTPHFTGPMSPQNHHSHHLNIPQDRFHQDSNYPYGSSQMQPSQQYQTYQYESRGNDEPPRRWQNYPTNNYRGSSM